MERRVVCVGNRLELGRGSGSSGGVSSYYPIPSWQTGISMTANQGSTAQRNIPDVAMVADSVFHL